MPTSIDVRNALPRGAFTLCRSIRACALDFSDPFSREHIIASVQNELTQLNTVVTECREAIIGSATLPTIPKKFVQDVGNSKQRGDARMKAMWHEIHQIDVDGQGNHLSHVQDRLYSVMIRNLGPLIYGEDTWEECLPQLMREHRWPYRPPQFALGFGQRRVGKTVLAAAIITTNVVIRVGFDHMIVANGKRPAQALLRLAMKYISQRLAVHYGEHSFEFVGVGGQGEKYEIYLKNGDVRCLQPIGTIAAFPQSSYVRIPACFAFSC